jgi:tetratricopeptide (TPR) repeat protein
MKRSERHHLKENEVALSVARAREQFEEHRRPVLAIGAAILVVIVAAGGFLWWRQHVDTLSRAMLVDAMAVEEAQVVPPPAPPAPGQPDNAANVAPPPGSFASEQAKLATALPKFLAAADAYPSTRAGIAARYHAGACLVALGRTKDAIEQYQQVIDRAGGDIYGDMGRLGLAEAQMQAQQYDAAINQYRDLSTKTNLPTDAILMQLGRAYAAAGRKAQAQQTFQRILDEFPQSQYAQLAKRELDATKGAGA